MTPLPDLVDEYLALRRALGYKLHRETWLLPRFVRFLQTRGQAWITTPLAVEWASQPRCATTATAAHRLTMIRGFAEYVRAQDPRTEVPAREWIPRVKQRQHPYLYTDAEVEALLAACWRLRSRGVRLTAFTLFGRSPRQGCGSGKRSPSIVTMSTNGRAVSSSVTPNSTNRAKSSSIPPRSRRSVSMHSTATPSISARAVRVSS